MSTHNIGFYEDLTKNIFELSSNIIKYATYYCCGIKRTLGLYGLISKFLNDVIKHIL